MTLVSLATIAALFASSLPGVRAQDAGAVPMSLSEALTKALENNLDLAVAKKDPEVAWNDVLFQKGAVDPLFTSTLSHTEFKSELSPFFIGGNVVYASPTSKTTDISAEIRQLLNFGASYSIGLTSQYNDSNPFNTYNPQYSTGLTLRFNLPLLKGFGRETTEYAPARRGAEHRHQPRGAARPGHHDDPGPSRRLLGPFWASMKAQEVAEQALKLAQDLADLNRKKVDVGTLAPIEITQAEANVAANVEGVITTKARR
jgi:outer membrane protein TolC